MKKTKLGCCFSQDCIHYEYEFPSRCNEKVVLILKGGQCSHYKPDVDEE